MGTSFEDELRGLVGNLDEDLAVKQTAIDVEQRERQAFLSEFRDAAQNVIIPVLKRAESLTSQAVRIEVKVAYDHVTLALCVTRDKKEPPDNYWVSFNADWRRKRIIVELRGKAVDALLSSQVTEAGVEQRVKEVFRLAQKPDSLRGGQ